MTISSTLIDPCIVGDLRLRSPNPPNGKFQFSLTVNSMPTILWKNDDEKLRIN
ncbi:hypothetical protein H6F86_23705 [Phormidium sp. FACHB-592]|uniref:Uncharacterized protein n=1 Tax=Stenomitos frigidus AS-A4 TaxID=2933935 RepID=A0ABV0KTR4_9CYAN|nr:hypothetical protein [Phormidium sp. FACHB-592]MBD2076837.1 hypothetical protein [Phormidium sp. FACHB-592]